MIRKLLIINALCAAHAIAGQADTLNGYKLAAVAGVTAGGFVVGHGMLNTLWWKGEYVPFHVNVEQDWKYALGADKAGHAFFPYAAGTAYAGAFRWCGMDSVAAAWSGAGLALAYQTYIEVRDGFSRDYGFSPGDMVADIAGAALPVVHAYVPASRAFALQISFRPSQAFHEQAYNAIIDDYTSTQHWLSINLADVLPGKVEWMPPWLGIAVGHTVENLDGPGGGNHVLLLGLDWHLARIPGLPVWLRDILEVVHVYHLPAPTLRFAPSRTTLSL